MKEKILFVTHREKQCGVYEFGMAVYGAVSQSGVYDFIHAPCDSFGDLAAALGTYHPDAVIYNYHPSVMPWLTSKWAKGLLHNRIARCKPVQIGIIHEVTQEIADSATAYRNSVVINGSRKKLNCLFDYYIAADPTLLLKNPYVFKTGRLLPAFENRKPLPSVPVIGSFGFATPKKGFERLVSKVKQEFSEALIRINMPYADFGDESGALAREVAANCRKRVEGSAIRIEITHDYLSRDGLLEFLASNSINVFMYEDKGGRGISSAVDFALAAGRPVAVSDCPMFRHILQRHPEICCESRPLKEIMDAGFSIWEDTLRDWDAETMCWEFERIVSNILDREKNRSSVNRGIKKTIIHFINKTLTRPEYSFSWINDTQAASPDNLIPDPSQTYEPVSLSDKDRFNRILDNRARELYIPAIAKMKSLVPATMAKKIPEANVQQAFVFDTVFRHLGGYARPRLLCVGSYEDTASLSLIKMGFSVTEVDPMINYFIQDFAVKPHVPAESFDIVFSTSVIEHDPDDRSFLESIDRLLAPGGLVVITCDFREGWKPGDPKPAVDARFYTKKDLEERMPSYLPGWEPVDEPLWDCLNPDFYLGGYNYTFATFTFRKK